MDSQTVKKRETPGGEYDLYRNMTTFVDIKPEAVTIEPDEQLYFGGSCFAENLHSFWKDHFLPSSAAPFGNIYNPRSLKDCFALLCGGDEVSQDDLVLQKELWHHPLFSTAAVDTDPSRLRDKINKLLREHKILLSESKYLILTLGTAFVFDEKSSGRTVNNCHKRPSSDFIRHPLTVDEIAQDLKDLASMVRADNKNLTLIMTLSPVRHLRDRAEENSLSKALLRCGIDLFLKEVGNSVYFPSSEIMLDELRDYRWYAEDLVHPSDKAVEYIMSRFCKAMGSRTLHRYLTEAEKLKQMMDHRVLHPQTEEAGRFIKKKEAAAVQFREKYPFSLF